MFASRARNTGISRNIEDAFHQHAGAIDKVLQDRRQKQDDSHLQERVASGLSNLLLPLADFRNVLPSPTRESSAASNKIRCALPLASPRSRGRMQ